MEDPQTFIPSYNPEGQQYETSCIEDLSVCCGNGCVCCAFPFALCCCKCCCVYELPTSHGNSIFKVAGIVEEFGRFKRLLKPGFNLINPCSE